MMNLYIMNQQGMGILDITLEELMTINEVIEIIYTVNPNLFGIILSII